MVFDPSKIWICCKDDYNLRLCDIASINVLIKEIFTSEYFVYFMYFVFILCIFFQVKWVILPIEFEDVAIIDLLANNAETDSGIGKKLFFIQ